MSLRTFNESLYREHFDELASMSELRAAWLRDGESTLDVVGLDDRMEAHLDALVLGGPVALEVATLAVRPDEPWTVHAWIAVVYRSAGAGT
ncbi:MAG: hypothetical protein KDK70_13260 [Myxococcales bacterium]|nr:hypothetical protein [Myxococcales bacterium]